MRLEAAFVWRHPPDMRRVSYADSSDDGRQGGETLGEPITNPVAWSSRSSPPSTEARDRGAKFEASKLMSSLEKYVLASQTNGTSRCGDEKPTVGAPTLPVPSYPCKVTR